MVKPCRAMISFAEMPAKVKTVREACQYNTEVALTKMVSEYDMSSQKCGGIVKGFKGYHEVYLPAAALPLPLVADCGATFSSSDRASESPDSLAAALEPFSAIFLKTSCMCLLIRSLLSMCCSERDSIRMRCPHDGAGITFPSNLKVICRKIDCWSCYRGKQWPPELQ